MSEPQRRFVATAMVVAIFSVAFWAFTIYSGEPVIRLAILAGNPESYIQEALDKWSERQHLRVSALSYEALREVVTHPSQLANFDVVMVDDVWLSDLVDRDQIAEVPADRFKNAMKLFVPEFLRSCYYRKDGETPRRPTLAQIERVDVRESFRLYALPYLGNAQALVAPETTVSSKLRSWAGIADALKTSKSPFYLRLGSNSSGLADFLPILWSHGGCLIGRRNLHEVSGLSPEGPALEALDLSVELARFSPVEYARFKDEEVDQQLSGSESPMGVSWLSYRIQRRKEQKPLTWYLMPDDDTKMTTAACSESEESVAAAPAQRTGVFGLWSLAVPRVSENQDLGFAFVKKALELQSAGKPSPQHQCTESRELTEKSDMMSPFEGQLTCDMRALIRHSRPRPAHPDWREIEAAVGLRLRQAHWKTKKSQDAAALASTALDGILNRRRGLDQEKHSARSAGISSSSSLP